MQAIIELFRGPTKQKRPYQVGIEVERLGMWPDCAALHYAEYIAHSRRRPGAEILLQELAHQNGWPVVLSSDNRPIGLKSSCGKVSLEPGSQLELSTFPHPHMDSLIREVTQFEDAVSKVTDPWGLDWLGVGHNPCNKVDDIDVIPAARYRYMTSYLGRRGRLATRMMRLTTSVQINLDYGSEPEGMEMLKVALLLAPFSYALFANSPYADGQKTPYLSYRAEIWRQTDPDRTGLLDEVFADGFDFEDYARLVWTRPLMFAQDSSENFVPAEGLSLADIAAGRLPGVVVDDNNRMNAVREIFTEARLKPGYIEIRSVDGLRIDYRYAATAFWMGVLYSKEAREFTLSHLGCLSREWRNQLMENILTDGLKAKHGKVDVGSISEELVKLARRGLQIRGNGEEKYLAPLEENVARRKNPANLIIESFEGEWHGDFSKLISYCGEKMEVKIQ